MKQLAMTCILSVMAMSLYARSSDDKSLLSRITDLAAPATSYDLNGDNLVFRGLSRNGADMYIMDSKGNIEESAQLTRRSNAVNISLLPKGTHIIAIRSGNKIKMFGYCSEVSVTALAKK